MKRLLLAGLSAFALFGAAFCVSAQTAEKGPVSELVRFVPSAKDYTLIYKFNPLEFQSKGYQTDNGENFSGKLKRIGYFLRTVDKQDKEAWAFVSMDPFSQELIKVGVPHSGSGVIQTYVTNMEVASNVPSVKTGKFEKGNIEFWCGNYGPGNSTKIPGASDGAFDFGDSTGPATPGYGSMQIHNYLEKQTVLAFNNIRANQTCDLGIGNAPGKNPDWTFTKSGTTYKTAEFIVVGIFEDLKVLPVIKVDNQKITFRGETEKAFYAPGETMNFTFTVNFGEQQLPPAPYTLKWSRSGDDGKKANGVETVVPGKPIIVKTSTDKPGFVRIQANLFDGKGRAVAKLNRAGKSENIFFDGGAGVEIEKLKPAVEEPADFDAFWTKQKEKLAKVPVKYKMEKVSAPDAKNEVYAVTVDCAGPRPVTGYLTMPANAAPKSLTASASYHGYGTGIQKAPGGRSGNNIHFDVNAHGYDLGKDAAYYKDFFEKIKSNGQGYAFDPKQNADPEQAYFNGMALRVMRSLQFLKSLPQWNGKNLSVSGGSQGGLQTIWAAALDPDVTYANSGITWCCDFAGTTIGRLGGWRPSYVPGLNYYDCVFHAKRIKCNILISRAGLGDYVCPPSGLAIMYNNLKAPKKIVYVQGSTHGFVPEKPQQFVIEAK